MSARISISDTRALAEAHPDLAEPLLGLIAAAEALRDIHDAECGCGRIGSPAACVWPAPDAVLLGRFDFDEEVSRR